MPRRPTVVKAPDPKEEPVKEPDETQAGTPEPDPAAATAAPAAATPDEEPTLEEYEKRRLELIAKLPPVAERPKTLYGKLALVTGLIGMVRKSGVNTFHHYKYAKESDLVEAIRPLLSELGIWVWWSLFADPEKGIKHHERLAQMKKDDRGGSYETTTLTAVTGQFKFVDAEGNSTEPQIIMGYGDDTSDKGLYKAYTGMEKYFLFKSFLVSTGDDPEADERADRRAAARDARDVEVRGRGGNRGGPQGGPPPQDVPEGAPRGRSTTAPGGHQRSGSKPQGQILRELLGQMGIRSSEGAITLIERVMGTTIPIEGDDKAASLAKYTGALSSQDMGKLIHDIRKVVEQEGKGVQAPQDPAKVGSSAPDEDGREQLRADDAAEGAADSSTLGAGLDKAVEGTLPAGEVM